MGRIWMDRREGILIRLAYEDGRVGFGEIAPLESFGSEAVEKAERLLQSFHESIDAFSVASVSDEEYPCTRYALECAMRQIKQAGKPAKDVSSELVPTARLIQNDAFDTVETPVRELARTDRLKIKIGDGAIEPVEEMKRLEKAIAWCRIRGKKIRLDANEQLDIEQTRAWLEFLSPHAEVVEFLEQPMDRCLLPELAELNQESLVPIALDESVAVLRYQESIPGKDEFLYVVKPSLGDVAVVEKLAIPEDRIILSSVFETAIGFSELLELPYRSWTGGFDTQSIFENDSLSYPMGNAGYYRRQIDCQSVWNRLL